MKPTPYITDEQESVKPIIRYRHYEDSMTKLRKQKKEYLSSKNYNKDIEDYLNKSTVKDSKTNKRSDKGRRYQSSTKKGRSGQFSIRLPDINFTRAFVGYK